MDAAFREAEAAFDAKEVPVGCVIVKEGRIVGRGRNHIESLQDATAHAEIIAIGAACSTLENWRLEDCQIYVTLEPCPMCAGAILNSRIASVFFAAHDKRLGACGTTMEVLKDNPLNREVHCSGGHGEEESLAMIRGFFRMLREK